jgi:hypothetical protein
LEIRAKLDRLLEPEAAASPMAEMTRNYLGNAMLRQQCPDDEDADCLGPAELD